jgi:hypothetical protein
MVDCNGFSPKDEKEIRIPRLDGDLSSQYIRQRNMDILDEHVRMLFCQLMMGRIF